MKYNTICVASGNKNKVEAVSDIAKQFEMFKDVKVDYQAAESGVSEQPLSMKEMIQGAKNRAEFVFKNCDYSFGIESGMVETPGTRDGYMNMCACAIYDGNKHHIGLSPGFELPEGMKDMIMKEGVDVSEAAFKLGITEHKKIGAVPGGMLAVLTDGRLSRQHYTRMAISYAMIYLEKEAKK